MGDSLHLVIDAARIRMTRGVHYPVWEAVPGSGASLAAAFLSCLKVILSPARVTFAEAVTQQRHFDATKTSQNVSPRRWGSPAGSSATY